MDLRGYMLNITWDGHTLTAEGTTKASQVALRGADHAAGPLVLERDQITGVDVKPANALVNGKLTLHTVDGGRYQLHYRRKQADGFTQLANELQPVSAPGQ
jgi:hypothetical protein